MYSDYVHLNSKHIFIYIMAIEILKLLTLQLLAPSVIIISNLYIVGIDWNVTITCNQIDEEF